MCINKVGLGSMVFNVKNSPNFILNIVLPNNIYVYTTV